jgi:adenylate cyclase
MTMTNTWLVRVYNDGVLAMFKECAGPVELGRQDNRVGEELYQVTATGAGGCRIAIASGDDLRISRRHARVEPSAAGRVVVRNTSDSNSVVFEDRHQLRPGQVREADLPVVLRFGAKVVRLQRATSDEAGRAVLSLDEPTAPPGEDDGRAATSTLTMAPSGSLETRSVFEWLRAMIRVLHSAACDADFFQKAAQAVVEVVGLDMGRVLTRDGETWRTAAFHPTEDGDYERSNPPSRLVLHRVCEEKKVSWFDPSGLDEDCSSLAGIWSVVAAPVRARSGDVIAILYGERRLQSLQGAGRPVSRLDAMLIEVLAVGLAAGLARVEQERAALALRAQFEQFFTPELAHVLAAQPKLLEGKDLEITALFADIRGFSRITRKQPPAFTVEWTQDVLSTLSECVLDHRGVLVDYIGDELVAMWGAPEEQPDHAERACRAALDMIAVLQTLNERWEARLGEPMGLGIGINTGLARVGNIGSRRKFKYGPLGDTVNVASRVQGASKYFKASLLITRATRDCLGPGFPLRRLGNARVVNIAEPIELFELFPPARPDSGELSSAYEEALAAFEAGEFRKATGILGRLVSVHRDDGPSFALLARAISNLVDEPESFDPAFRLPGK